MIKVFIENEADSDQKNIYNEKTLEHKKTYTVSRKYPFPYGFILNTTSGDGDNVDCFILTQQPLKTGQTIECEVVGMMEQVEDGKSDHNILASLPEDQIVINEKVKNELTDFVSHVFDHLPNKLIKVGAFLDQVAAKKFIRQSIDPKKMEGSVG